MVQLAGVQHPLSVQSVPWLCRDLCPEDYNSLRSAHVELFPVDYEEAFFERIVHQKDGLESLAAFSRLDATSKAVDQPPGLFECSRQILLSALDMAAFALQVL